jgi:starch-binding outer membrane protein, SusD/RagB family
MKKYILYALLILVSSSCTKEFTELSPISERNIKSAYKTEADFAVAVNGLYDALQLNGTYGKTYLLLNEMRSDNTSNGGGCNGIAQSLCDVELFKEITTANELSNAWSDSYRGIARCNIFLDKLDGSSVPDALKKRYRGEALYIRSLLYYNLAIIFGNIPLQLVDAASPADVDLKQYPANDVYNQIITDLIAAEPLLPASYASADLGRVTKGAVNTLLGKVYLTKGDKPAAVTALNKVVNSKNYSLVSDYARLWGAANENGPESIFEIQYKTGGQGEGSGYLEYFASIIGRAAGVGGGNTPMTITPDLLSAYQAGDQRYAKSIYKNNRLPDTTYSIKYLSVQTTAFDGDNNWYVSRYADVLLMLAEALGESTQAYVYINQVRARAGLPAIAATTPSTFAKQLLDERRLEFAFENQRWQDLLRFGVAKSTMAKQLAVTEAEIRLLFAIPQKEIDVSNGKLVQNPGL